MKEPTPERMIGKPLGTSSVNLVMARRLGTNGDALLLRLAVSAVFVAASRRLGGFGQQTHSLWVRREGICG